MNQVFLEHLVMRVDTDGMLVLTTRLAPLPPMADPVQVAFDSYPGAFTHSTSWRWVSEGVILTFAHVLPDASVGTAGDTPPESRFTAVDLERLTVCCHAVRHLHFVVRTDAAIATIAGYDRFWAFAAEVADHHYPAVAGLLPDAPEYQI